MCVQKTDSYKFVSSETRDTVTHIFKVQLLTQIGGPMGAAESKLCLNLKS